MLSILGKATWYIGRPVFRLLLQDTKRARVAVVCGSEMLVMQPLLGKGSWTLPGGGIHTGEEPRAAAVRELFEETGVVVCEGTLQFLYESEVVDGSLRYTAVCFSATIVEKQPLRKRWWEVSKLEWVAFVDLAVLRLAPDVTEALVRLEQRG